MGRWLMGAALCLAIGGGGCLARPDGEESASPATLNSASAAAANPAPAAVTPSAKADPAIERHPPLDENQEADAVYFYLLGQIMARESRWQVAEEAFSRVARLDPDAADARMMAAQLAVQRGDLRKATQYAREVVELMPESSDARVLLAAVYSATNHHEEAAAEYEALLRLDPDNDNARLFLAQTQGRLKHLDEAKRTLAPLFQKNAPNAWKAHLAMGRIMTEQGSLETALPHFKQARQLAPHELEPVLTLGAALQELDRVKEVEALYREYLTAHPEDMAVHSQLGRLLLTQEEHDAALKEFRAITRIAPDSVQARLMTSLVLLAQNKYEEALKDLRLAEALQPDNTTILFYLAQALEGAERAEEAMGYYRRIQPNQTWYMESQLRLSFLEASRGQVKEAIRKLQELLKQHPGKVELHLALSFLLLQEKEYQQVVEVCTQGLAVKSGVSRLVFNRAMALDKLGRWTEAETDLLAYLQSNPDDAQALNYLGYSWAERGTRLSEAHAMLVKAVRLAPADGYIADSLGWVLHQMGRHDDALDVLRQAVRLAPDDPTITEHLADTLWSLQLQQEALDTWRKALALDPKNDKLKEKLRRHEQGE